MPTLGEWTLSFQHTAQYGSTMGLSGSSQWLCPGAGLYYKSGQNWVAIDTSTTTYNLVGLDDPNNRVLAVASGDNKAYLMSPSGSAVLLGSLPQSIDLMGLLGNPAKLYCWQRDGDFWRAPFDTTPWNWVQLNSILNYANANFGFNLGVGVDVSGSVFTYSMPLDAWSPYGEAVGPTPPPMLAAGCFSPGKVVGLGTDGNLYLGGFSQPFWRLIGPTPGIQTLFFGDPANIWGTDRNGSIYFAPLTL